MHVVTTTIIIINILECRFIELIQTHTFIHAHVIRIFIGLLIASILLCRFIPNLLLFILDHFLIEILHLILITCLHLVCLWSSAFNQNLLRVILSILSASTHLMVLVELTSGLFPLNTYILVTIVILLRELFFLMLDGVNLWSLVVITPLALL